MQGRGLVARREADLVGSIPTILLGVGRSAGFRYLVALLLLDFWSENRKLYVEWNLTAERRPGLRASGGVGG